MTLESANCRLVHSVARVLLPLLMMIALSACMGTSKPPHPVYYYTLEYATPAVQTLQQLPFTLRVERFSVSPPYNSQRIIYAHDGLQRNAYAYHQWIASPGDMLPYFLARDLRHSNAFRAVLTPDASLPATHSLFGWVEEFVEKDASDYWQAVATINITLISNLDKDPSRRILLQKRYNAAARCKSRTPEALAEAMSSAVAQISQAVMEDVYQRLSTVEPLNY